MMNDGQNDMVQFQMDAMTDEIRSLRDQLDKLRTENETLRASSRPAKQDANPRDAPFTTNGMAYYDDDHHAARDYGNNASDTDNVQTKRPSIVQFADSSGSERSIELNFRRNSMKKVDSCTGLDSLAGMDSCAGIFGDGSDDNLGYTYEKERDPIPKPEPNKMRPPGIKRNSSIGTPRSVAVAVALKNIEKMSKKEQWQNDGGKKYKQEKDNAGEKNSDRGRPELSKKVPESTRSFNLSDVDAALDHFSHAAKHSQYGLEPKINADPGQSKLSPISGKRLTATTTEELSYETPQGPGVNNGNNLRKCPNDNHHPHSVQDLNDQSDGNRPRCVPPLNSDSDRPLCVPPINDDDSIKTDFNQSMMSVCTNDMSEALRHFTENKTVDTASKSSGHQQRRSSLAACRSTTFTYDHLHEQQKQKMDQVGILSVTAGVFVHPDGNKLGFGKKRCSSILSQITDDVLYEANEIGDNKPVQGKKRFSKDEYEVEAGDNSSTDNSAMIEKMYGEEGVQDNQSYAKNRSSLRTSFRKSFQQHTPKRGSVRLVMNEMPHNANPPIKEEVKQEVASQKKVQCSGKSFDQFVILSVKPETLSNNEKLIMDERIFIDEGPRSLDSFFLENSCILDMFPSKKWSIPIDQATLSSFCFPNGVKVRVIPKVALEGAKRIGWAGKRVDQHNILVFTNETHEYTYGVAIIIQDEIFLPSKSSDGNCALRHRLRRRWAAAFLCRWWRKTIKHRKIWNSIHYENRRGSELSTQSEKISSPSLKKSMKRSVSMQPKIVKKVLRGGKKKKKKDSSEEESQYTLQSMHDMPCKDTSHHSTLSLHSNTSEHDQCEQSQLERIRFHSRRKKIAAERKSDAIGLNGTKNVDARRKAAESYKAMKDAERLGHVCLVEKCYVIVGVRQNEQIILLSALQKLVDYERNGNYDTRNANVSKSGKPGKISQAKFDQILLRHNSLAFMQNQLFLSEEECKITFPQSQMEMVHSKCRYFEKSVPIPDALSIRLPLPLPQIGEEWGLAQLLLTIGPDSLMLALKLLLLERPVLILGERLQTVTSCACALVALLKPYEWASTFMPMLPYSMLDFINSPVPFIAGMAVDGPHRVSLIENDERTMQAMAEGMSLINLTTGSLMITSEPGIAKKLKVPFYLRETLTSLYYRLRTHGTNPSSVLRSFKKFADHGFSPRERVTLHSVSLAIEDHFKSLAADIASSINGWNQYGKNDAGSETFDFYPAWFMRARREELQYQEAMVCTQLFLGYVDSRRNANLECERLRQSEAGQRIAKWIFKKLEEHKY